MNQARIADPQLIRDFRQRLAHFLGSCATGLGGVPGDYAHVLDWLQGQQLGHWKKQLQRRDEAHTTARLAYLEAEADVRASRNGRGGGRQSSDDERREMIRAARLRDEAESKLAAVKRWIHVLETDGATLVHQCRNHDLALREHGILALTKLERMAESVDTYLEVKTTMSAPIASASASLPASPTSDQG